MNQAAGLHGRTPTGDQAGTQTEQRFYLVMRLLTEELWLRGLAVNALQAMTEVLAEASGDERRQLVNDDQALPYGRLHKGATSQPAPACERNDDPCRL